MTVVISQAPARAGKALWPATRPAGGADMRGRDAEWRVVGDLLRRTRNGAAGVVLVEGERGTGKSLLLREAGRAAVQQGFSLTPGRADRLVGGLPLFPLRQAFGRPAVAGHRGGTDYFLSQVRGFQERLTERAGAAPLVVTFDDLQWASRETLQALRILPRELDTYPVAWILARSKGYQNACADCLFDALEGEGAARFTLEPLTMEAMAGMLADAFGAPADEGLVALAASAEGNPSLLAGLISGLGEEEAIGIRDGRASLVKVLVPRRVSDAARQRLGELSGPARQLLAAGALLDGAFQLSDVTELLGAPPTALLASIDEAMSAGLLVADANSFAFRHGLLARAVAELIPPPVRRVMHRELGAILLRRRDSAGTAAVHLLEAAQDGDAASLTALDRAVREAAGSSPQTAAELALRALQLTSPSDTAALPRAVAAAEMLTAAGQLAEAARIARDTLALPIPARAEARVRCALSSILLMTSQAREAADEARKVLVLTELDGEVQQRAQAVLVQAGAAPPDDEAMTAAARTARSVTAWNAGRAGEALELLREAARAGPGVAADARHCQPLLVLCARLVDLRQLDDALSAIRAVAGRLPDDCLPRVPLMLLRSRVYLAQGEVAKATAEGEAAMAGAVRAGANAYTAAAHFVLGAIALRQGDHRSAARHTASAAVMPTHVAMAYAPAETVMTALRVAEAGSGPAAALGQLGGDGAVLTALRPALLSDSVAGAWLVRAALAGGRRALAEQVAAAVDALASGNPGWPTVTAAAAHVLGLMTERSECLERAAAHYEEPWACASAAEDLAVLLVRRGRADQAVEYLNTAAEGYSRGGALADKARVRARLRELGVRQRHWRQVPGRPAAGWESLTVAERAVAELVAQGLTNRQTANRLYVSSHTVSYHMHKAFQKLGIGSRVELARMVIEQSQK
jgi:DNA-binding CsgD family transcriptional regulator